MTARRPHVLFGWKPEWKRLCGGSCLRAGFSSVMQPLGEARLGSFDAVVPLTLADQAFLEAGRVRGAEIPAVLTDSAARQLCHDKLQFAWRISEVGFADYVPRLLDPRRLGPGDFPVVMKARRGEFGRGTSMIGSLHELEAHLPKLDAGEAFLQELIPGNEEFAVHIFLDGGRMLFSSTMHYMMASPNLVKGVQCRPAIRIWDRSAPFKPLWYSVLSRLGIQSGTFCIDYRLRAGKPVIFEINPRVGSSLAANMEDYLKVYVSCFGGPPRLAIG